MTRTFAALSAALALAAPACFAAGDDVLWEVTSEMSMAGMPPGMGAMTQQVCTDKDPKKGFAQGQDMEQCKIADYKESGNRVTIAVKCPDSTAVIEHTYNAARTEYKSVMKMKSKDGDMVMNSTGRKIGSCDARQARRQQQEQVAAVQQQGNQAMAQMQASMAASEDLQIKQCSAALEGMQAQNFGTYAHCASQKGMCETMAQNEMTQRSAKACMASSAEYCKRYRTMEGFLKAKGDEHGARMCDVSRDELRASFCPRAARSENLEYLGRFCPVEAKPLAQQHCVGRSYTSRVRDKYTEFCSAYLAQADLAEPPRRAAQPAPTKDPKAAVTEGVTQGINKLKGLFGR